MNLLLYAQQYREDLLQRIVPFWLDFAIDRVNGGYFCVLSNKGEVISTDKWMAWHGQQAWAFAKLFQNEAQPTFLDYARQGADFLLQYVTDTKETWWESVDITGRGVVEVKDTQVEAAACAAWGILYDITKDDTYAEAAKKTLIKAVRKREKRLQKFVDEPLKGRHLKQISELNALARALTTAKNCLSEKAFRERGEALLNELMKHFWEPRADILLENVFSEGGYSDCLLGRRIHAGRVFETFNSFYELTYDLNKRQIRRQLAQHIAYLAETTWDEAYGGYYHWLDVKSLPATEPDAYYKYAWVQLEACTALLRAYQVLQDRSLLKQWQRVNDYIWQHFPDPSPEGEWIGVVNRHGEPLLPLKATSNKNAFSPIKNLLISSDLLANLDS